MSATIKVISLPKRSDTTASDVTVTAPTAGSGWVVKSAIPFADAQGPAMAIVYDDTSVTAKQQANENITPSAGATVTRRYFFTSAAVLTKLALWALTAPASAGGSVLFTAKKNGSTTVLSTANYDAEGISNATYTAMSLTGTAADLSFAAGDHLELKIVSSNGDMTGAADMRAAFEYQLS